MYVSGTNDVSPVDIGVLDLESLETHRSSKRPPPTAVSPCHRPATRSIFVNSSLPLPPEGDGGFALSKPGIYEVPLDGGDPDDRRARSRPRRLPVGGARQRGVPLCTPGSSPRAPARCCCTGCARATPSRRHRSPTSRCSPRCPRCRARTPSRTWSKGTSSRSSCSTEPGRRPVHIDDGVTAFAWVHAAGQ